MDKFEPRPLTLTPELYWWPQLFNPREFSPVGPTLPPQFAIHVAALALPADLQDGLRVKDGKTLIKHSRRPVVTAEQGWEWLERLHREAVATNTQSDRLLTGHKLRIMYSGIRFRAIPRRMFWHPDIKPDQWSLSLHSVEVLK